MPICAEALFNNVTPSTQKMASMAQIKTNYKWIEVVMYVAKSRELVGDFQDFSTPITPKFHQLLTWFCLPKLIRKIAAWLGMKEFNDMSLGGILILQAESTSFQVAAAQRNTSKMRCAIQLYKRSFHKELDDGQIRELPRKPGLLAPVVMRKGLWPWHWVPCHD